MTINDLTYWVTLGLMSGIRTRRKNELFVACYNHQPQYSISDLFERVIVRKEIGITQNEETSFVDSYNQLANNTFLVEDLLSQGYDIIPITSPDYPRTLKTNLKMGSPCVIYIKGNKELLNKPSIAIVGSRQATETSLKFTTNIARLASSQHQVVVSGFAKGVDRQALDSAIESGGSSIIVLPQGIMTFVTGFKQYYQQIAQGRVAVISTFPPKAPWRVEFAMARNSIIYGFASEIYVAQSEYSGGTWSGAMEGLRKGRKIYVRNPDPGEKSANIILIGNGAIGVDFYGNIVYTGSLFG